MSADAQAPLAISLVADDTYRIALLRRVFRDAGVPCTIHRVPMTTGARAFLKARTADGCAREPDLVLCDFASVEANVRRAVQAIAFGSQRSPVPVVLLTSRSSEALLDGGELDDGQATMFSARPLEFIVRKLAGGDRPAFLRALKTLYRYGPVLARQPACFLAHGDELTELSA